MTRSGRRIGTTRNITRKGKARIQMGHRAGSIERFASVPRNRQLGACAFRCVSGALRLGVMAPPVSDVRWTSFTKLLCRRDRAPATVPKRCVANIPAELSGGFAQSQHFRWGLRTRTLLYQAKVPRHPSGVSTSFRNAWVDTKAPTFSRFGCFSGPSAFPRGTFGVL